MAAPTASIRRAPLPFGLLLPGRGLAARGARRARGRARLHGARADRPQLGLGLDGARPERAGARGAGDPRAAELTSVACGAADRRRHLTLLVRDARGWSNLCRILTLAHAHTREGTRRREPASRPVAVEAVLEHAEGLVCLTGCAARSASRGRRRRAGGPPRRAAGRRLRDALRPRALRVELQRPFARHDRARNRALAAARPAAGAACVATGDVHAHHRCAGRAAGRLRGPAPPRHARGLRAAAAGQPQPRDEPAAGDGPPLRRPPGGGRARRSRWPSG